MVHSTRQRFDRIATWKVGRLPTIICHGMEYYFQDGKPNPIQIDELAKDNQACLSQWLFSMVYEARDIDPGPKNMCWEKGSNFRDRRRNYPT